MIIIPVHLPSENDEPALAEPRQEVATPEPQYELAMSEPQYELEIAVPQHEQPPPTKRRKKKSIVWEHFQIETVSPGCRRAVCNECKKTFSYSAGSKVSGTSHLKRHIEVHVREKKILFTPDAASSKIDANLTPTGRLKRRYKTANPSAALFDPQGCRREIAKMIIMHDYPLHIVEHPGFVASVQNLQPQFKMPGFRNVEGDCIATYLHEKLNVQWLLEAMPGRISLSLDLWTSSQTVGYVVLTGHFVDRNWKLQRRILNVVIEPYPECDTTFGHAVARCLSDWNLEGKLFSVSLNQRLSEIGRWSLQTRLCIKNPLILSGQFLICNCVARMLSCMAQDVLEAGRETIEKIRNNIKHVKTWESHEERFLELKQQLQVPTTRSLSLDNARQWNTTYEMLVAASELRQVFVCLNTIDPDYKGADVTMEDWKIVETLCINLKLLFDPASMLTATSCLTLNTFFPEVCKMQSELALAVCSDDPFTRSFINPMMEKFNGYWKDCSLVLALAIVMDPRFKLKFVKFSFNKIYDMNYAISQIKIVDDGIHELFLEYEAGPLTPVHDDKVKMEESSQGESVLSSNGFQDFDAYLMKTSSHHLKSELDLYLDDPLASRSQPDFDVLRWWERNSSQYPTLSRMARDILSVPVCTVPPESVFDTASKEMDQYRCSLQPLTVEALICAKDWLQYQSAPLDDSITPI